MSTDCNLCHLLRIQSRDDQEGIDDGIKANSRHQLSQVEGFGLTVDEFMAKKSCEVDQQNPERQRRFLGANNKCPFRGYCHEVFRNHPGDKVQCRICGKIVTVRDKNKKLTTKSSFDHACVHLGKPIFACAHCDNEFTCRGSVSSHLQSQHKLPAQPINYIDSSANYEKEILEMLERCYSNAGSATVISGGPIPKMRSFRHKNSCPLSNFTRKLIKPNKDGKIPCAVCGRVLGFQNNSIYSFINHARIHLGKPVFKCGQCDLQFCTMPAIQRHIVTAHVLSFCKENYIDMSSSYEKDMMDILERCFGQQNLVKVEPSEEPNQKPSSQRLYFKNPLSNICRKLFANLPLDAIVRCSLCGSEKKLHLHGQISTIRFVSHALLHLAKPIFRCRLCDRSTLTRHAMNTHLYSVHKVAATKANFVDDSSKYQKEIIAMLEKCFDQAHTDVQVSSGEKRSAGRAQAAIRGRAGPDTLLAERKIRCYEVTRKFQKSGKVKCRVCRLEMHPEKGMVHVIAHLNKLIYRCRLCKRSFTARSSIQQHVKATHGQSGINNFEDRSNDFHAELLELISGCFDWDRESANGHAKEDHALRNTCHIIGLSRGNDLKAARLLHCHRLAQKFSQDGRVSCRICSASLVVCMVEQGKKGHYYSSAILNHAARHLKKVNRFKCTLCTKAVKNRNTMTEHLKRVHNSTSKADWDDRTDVYHPKIMKILTKCFDWSQN